MSEQDLLKTDIAGYLARQAEKDTLRFIQDASSQTPTPTRT